MKRSEIRAFVKSGVDALVPAVSFNSGLLTFFNSNRTNQYPYVFQETGSISTDINFQTGPPLDQWEIILHIAYLDSMDSIPDQYELLVDKADEIAQKLITKYNQIVSGYKNVTIEGIGREPFVHKHADCLSGVILTFTIVSPDKTNNC